MFNNDISMNFIICLKNILLITYETYLKIVLKLFAILMLKNLEQMIHFTKTINRFEVQSSSTTLFLTILVFFFFLNNFHCLGRIISIQQ